MNIIVHLMFAVSIRNRLKKRLGISLNLRGFLYGNILPDISRKYGAHPHYIKVLLLMLFPPTRSFHLKTMIPFTPIDLLKARVINHYLSDFSATPIPRVQQIEGPSWIL